MHVMAMPTILLRNPHEDQTDRKQHGNILSVQNVFHRFVHVGRYVGENNGVVIDDGLFRPHMIVIY